MTHLLIQSILTMCSVQGSAVQFRYDAAFGPISRGRDGYLSSASQMWAYKLVDTWSIAPPPHVGGETGVRPAAHPALMDLLARMNRPIVKEVAEGNIHVKPSSPADQLAAGIALWTIAYREDVWHRPSKLYFSEAEAMLAKASKHGDSTGRSFASLAHAYCLLGDKGLPPKDSGVPLHGEPLERLNRCKAALIATYKEFYSSAPLVSLKAAKGVLMLCIEQRLTDEIDQWSRTIDERFPKYRDWGPDN